MNNQKGHFHLFSIKVAFYSTGLLSLMTLFGYFSNLTIPLRVIIALGYILIFMYLRNDLLKLFISLRSDLLKKKFSKKKFFAAYFTALVLTLFLEFHTGSVQYSLTGKSYFRGFTVLFVCIYLFSFYSIYRIKLE